MHYIASKLIDYRTQYSLHYVTSGILIYLLKGTSHDSIFQFSLFPTLADIFAVERPLLCTKLIHQSSPAEMTYLVQERQIFAV